jgi:tetratricopeptide (TPR) repeat protein
MTGSTPKAAAKAGAAPAGLPERLTPAGQFIDAYESLRRSDIPPAALAGTPGLPRSRLRAARQQADLGVRLAREGKLALAIKRLAEAARLDPHVASVQFELGSALFRAGHADAAAAALRRAIGLDPDFAEAHLRLALTLDYLGREAEAQPALEAAVRLDPTQHAAHARLAHIALSKGDLARAEAAFGAAAGAAGAGSWRARVYEARIAILRGRLAEAEALLQAVIEDEPDCGEALVVLGQVQAEAGRSGEAVVNFERGIALDARMVGAWSNLATNHKFGAGDQRLVEAMRAAVEGRGLMPWQRQAVHFALAKALDDMGEAEGAMRHYDAANRIRAARGRLNRERLAAQTAHVIAAAPPGFLDRRPDFGVDDPTPVLIVGMPRSGTTLVEQILSSHPAVAAGGELPFWRERNQAQAFGADAPVEEVRRVATDYLAVLRGIAPEAARVTDKTPFNFAHLGAIRQLFPRATIVHCCRHAVDTCLSIYGTDFQIAYDFAADRGDLVFFYRQYQELMAHWRSVLPPDRFIEVDYEALVADPEPLTRRLVATAGLEWDDACLAPQRNQRRIATASLWQARQPIYRTSVARWRRYEPWLGELRALLVDAPAAVPEERA